MLKNLLVLHKDLGTSCKRHTVFCGEHIFISYQLLHRAHDKINILGGSALDLLPPLVIPVVLSEGTETLVRVSILPNTRPSVGSHIHSKNSKAVAAGCGELYTTSNGTKCSEQHLRRARASYIGSPMWHIYFILLQILFLLNKSVPFIINWVQVICLGGGLQLVRA